MVKLGSAIATTSLQLWLIFSAIRSRFVEDQARGSDCSTPGATFGFARTWRTKMSSQSSLAADQDRRWKVKI